MNVPISQLVAAGGDTAAIASFEYRIPIVGPLLIAPYLDAGLNRISLPRQLQTNQAWVDQLNAWFPQAGATGNAKIINGSQVAAMSTGVEAQIRLPILHAPLRFYFAYNPVASNPPCWFEPQIVADRSFFPNQATFGNFLANYGTAYRIQQNRTSFRFALGKTF